MFLFAQFAAFIARCGFFVQHLRLGEGGFAIGSGEPAAGAGFGQTAFLAFKSGGFGLFFDTASDAEGGGPQQDQGDIARAFHPATLQ
ncbi:MAG: hypothetical protein ACD_54C00713G0002 [uncultured bacterium]|nr:MAG: hypothetical protein ACD_54C00713G0002 [uncultured bacterium]